jgi:hypothetical protein
MKQPFEITKRSPRPTTSLLTPAAACVRGQPLQESAVAGQAELADGSKPFAGWLTRVSQVGGPALGDVIYPGRLELPFVAGQEGTTEFAEWIELEGASYLDAGITGATPLKTPLSFKAGLVAVATSGQFVEHMLVEQQTPVTAGNVRIRIAVVPGYLKP